MIAFSFMVNSLNWELLSNESFLKFDLSYEGRLCNVGGSQPSDVDFALELEEIVCVSLEAGVLVTKGGDKACNVLSYWDIFGGLLWVLSFEHVLEVSVSVFVTSRAHIGLMLSCAFM